VDHETSEVTAGSETLTVKEAFEKTVKTITDANLMVILTNFSSDALPTCFNENDSEC
jgi:hypothetical protein